MAKHSASLYDEDEACTITEKLRKLMRKKKGNNIEAKEKKEKKS